MTRKLLPAILSIAALIGSCSSLGFAQTDSKLMATIPFTFVFEGATLPAGTYEVELMDSGMLLLLNSNHAPVEGEVATLPLPLRNVEAGPELLFLSSSQGYELVEVRTKEERRLLTSAYGRARASAQQFRGVPITTVAEKQAASSTQASAQGR